MISRLVRFLVSSHALVNLVVFFAVWHWYGITPVITAVFIGAAFLSCFFAWDEQYKKAEAPRVTPSTERAFLRDGAAVFDLYGKTNMSSFQAMNEYLDNWVKIAGRFEGSAESLQRDAIHVSVKLDSGKSLPLRFAMNAKDHLATLRTGERITVVSQIHAVPNYGNGHFALANSELVTADKARAA